MQIFWQFFFFSSLQDNEVDKKLSRRLQVFQGSVASGVHRKLILGSTTKHEKLRFVLKGEIIFGKN